MIFPLGTNSELTEMTSDSNTTMQFPSNVQCYWQLPKPTLLLFDVCIFIMLGLAGMYRYMYMYHTLYRTVYVQCTYVHVGTAVVFVFAPYIGS